MTTTANGSEDQTKTAELQTAIDNKRPSLRIEGLSKVAKSFLEKAESQCSNSETGRQAVEMEARRKMERVKDLERKAEFHPRHMRKIQLDAAQSSVFSAAIAKIGIGFTFGLAGDRGTGKTQLAVCIGREFCAAEKLVRYATAIQIFARLREAYKVEGVTEQGVMNEFCRPALLIIDESHVRGDTSFEDRMLTSIIDTRYMDLRDTILLTNQNAIAFSSTLGESVVDRMRECGGFIECSIANGWQDHRGGK